MPVAGRAVVLVAALLALLVGPALCTGLRVVVRTRSLVAMLPLEVSAVRLAHVVVPGAALLVFALASAPALLSVLPPLQAWGSALAVGLAGLASTVRWVTASPPDYASPLIATPAGAIPPGAVGSALRGVDVLAVTTVPLLLGGWGIVASLVLAAAVLWWLVWAAD